MIGLDEADDTTEQTATVWAVFGDLMAGLLGAFVLVLVGTLMVQMDRYPPQARRPGVRASRSRR